MTHEQHELFMRWLELQKIRWSTRPDSPMWPVIVGDEFQAWREMCHDGFTLPPVTHECVQEVWDRYQAKKGQLL